MNGGIFKYHLKNRAQQITPTQLDYKATRRSSCLLLKTRSRSSLLYLMNSSETSFSIRRVYKGTSWLRPERTLALLKSTWKEREAGLIWRPNMKRPTSSLFTKSCIVLNRPAKSLWCRMIQMSNLMARIGQYSTLKQRWQSIRKWWRTCYLSRLWWSGVWHGHWKGHSYQDPERWQIWLEAIGNINAPLQKVIDQATCFVSACCYGIKDSTDMTHTRLLKEEWEGSFVFPKLACCSTNERSFYWKCEESHFQTVLWRNPGSFASISQPRRLWMGKDHKQIILFNCSSREL